MNNETTENNPTKYIVAELTLQDVMDKIKENRHPTSRIKVYEHEIDRSDLSDEQDKIQKANQWTAELSPDAYLSNDLLLQLVEETVYDEIFNGTREELYKKSLEEIMATKLTISASIGKHGEDDYYINSNCEFTDKIVDRDKYYSTDLNKFEEELKNVRRPNSFYTTYKENFSIVWLERFSVSICNYNFSKANLITSMLKKFIRDNLTYCIKKDKIIIPESYIAKGKEGIKEWRDLKKSSNKNNSIEKKLLQELYAKKKKTVHDFMHSVTASIEGINNSWEIPHIVIYGRWNKQRMMKLENNILSASNRAAFMKMSEEEIEKKIKDYWKDILMQAYKAVDKTTIKEQQ